MLKLLEICAQNQGNTISEDPKFKNFPGEHAPGPPQVKSASGARLWIGQAIYIRNPSMQKGWLRPGFTWDVWRALKELELLSAVASSNSYASFVLSILSACIHNSIYYIDTSVLLENRPLVKFIENHIRDSSGVFSIMISSLVRISMISLISCLSLKLYVNSSMYDRNMFGSSSKVFGNVRQCSEIFRKCSPTFLWPSDKF